MKVAIWQEKASRSFCPCFDLDWWGDGSCFAMCVSESLSWRLLQRSRPRSTPNSVDYLHLPLLSPASSNLHSKRFALSLISQVDCESSLCPFQLRRFLCPAPAVLSYCQQPCSDSIYQGLQHWITYQSQWRLWPQLDWLDVTYHLLKTKNRTDQSHRCLILAYAAT